VFASPDTTKGKSDERIPLHGAVVEHLKPLQASEIHEVFPWTSDKRYQYIILHNIQDKAGVGGNGRNGGYFGYHDLPRGYATTKHMDLFELQKLMQHCSLETIREHVSMPGKLKRAIKKVHIPEFLTVRKTFTRQAGE